MKQIKVMEFESELRALKMDSIDLKNNNMNMQLQANIVADREQN